MTHNPRLRNLDNAELYLTASNVTASVAQIDNFTSENVLVNQATIYGRNSLSQTPNQAFIEYSPGDDKLVLFPGAHLSGNLTVQGTISSSGNITTAGDLAVNGGDITSTQATLNINAGGTVRIQDNLTVDGDLAVNGGDITSTQAILNINAGGTVNIQDDLTVQGTISSSGNITTAGDLVVNGGDITSASPILNIDAGGTVNIKDNLTVEGTISSSGNITAGGNIITNGSISTGDGNSTITINPTNTVIDVSSSLPALRVTQRGPGYVLRVEDEANPDNTPFLITNIGWVGIGIEPGNFFHVSGSATIGSNLSVNGASYNWPSNANASQTNVFLKNDNKTLSWVPLGYSNDVTTVTGNHTLNTITEVLLVNNTTAATITLPNASGNTGKFYDIKRIGTAAVTISGSSGQTIDGASSYILNTAYQTVTLVTNGTNWFIL